MEKINGIWDLEVGSGTIVCKCLNHQNKGLRYILTFL